MPGVAAAATGVGQRHARSANGEAAGGVVGGVLGRELAEQFGVGHALGRHFTGGFPRGGAPEVGREHEARAMQVGLG